MTGSLVASIPSPDQSVWQLGPLPIRAYALCILVGIFVAMWVGDRRWVARGLMPAPIRLGLRTVVWDAEEIEQWQAARAAAPRDQPE